MTESERSPNVPLSPVSDPHRESGSERPSGRAVDAPSDRLLAGESALVVACPECKAPRHVACAWPQPTTGDASAHAVRIAAAVAWYTLNRAALRAARRECAVCGADLGELPGGVDELAPRACSLPCFYKLHPDRKAEVARNFGGADVLDRWLERTTPRASLERELERERADVDAARRLRGELTEAEIAELAPGSPAPPDVDAPTHAQRLYSRWVESLARAERDLEAHERKLALVVGKVLAARKRCKALRAKLEKAERELAEVQGVRS